MTTQTLFIGGRWRDGAAQRPIRCPYDGSLAGSMSEARHDDVLEAIEHARMGSVELGAAARAAVLTGAAERLASRRMEFARLIVAEAGTALKDALREVERALALLLGYAEEAKRMQGQCVGTDVTPDAPRRLAISWRVPLGVVFAVTPFNRPLNQVVVKVAPAIAAGNRVLLKPSEKTPLSAAAFVRLLLESGLPPAMLQLLTGDAPAIASAILASDVANLFTFTGSTRVGKLLARACGMARVTLELGDSGAAIVLPDADLRAAASAVAQGAFASAGQSCRGVKRVYVHRDVADAFAALLVERAAALQVGDPRAPETDIGTLIDEDAAERAEQPLREALAQGARVLIGNRRARAQLWPSVIDHVPEQAALVQQEVFAPYAPIVRIGALEEAIGSINAGQLGLQAGIFTQNLSWARAAAEQLQVGTVVINGGPQFDAPNLPFGGCKDSGMGREGLAYSMQEMTTLKTMVL